VRAASERVTVPRIATGHEIEAAGVCVTLAKNEESVVHDGRGSLAKVHGKTGCGGRPHLRNNRCGTEAEDEQHSARCVHGIQEKIREKWGGGAQLCVSFVIMRASRGQKIAETRAQCTRAQTKKMLAAMGYIPGSASVSIESQAVVPATATLTIADSGGHDIASPSTPHAAGIVVLVFLVVR
jgi:hypothetical protein